MFDPTKYHLSDLIKVALMVTEILMLEDDNFSVAGEVGSLYRHPVGMGLYGSCRHLSFFHNNKLNEECESLLFVLRKNILQEIILLFYQHLTTNMAHCITNLCYR